MSNHSQFLRAEILRQGSMGWFWETPHENYLCPVFPLALGQSFWLFIKLCIVQVGENNSKTLKETAITERKIEMCKLDSYSFKTVASQLWGWLLLGGVWAWNKHAHKQEHGHEYRQQS